MTKPLKLSPSGLAKYWRCPELFRKIYIDKEEPRTRPDWKMVAGTGAHKAMDFAFKAKKRGRECSVVSMLMVGEREIEKVWKAGVKLSVEEAIVGGESSKRQALQKMERCVRAVHKKLVPKVDVIDSEKWIEIPWDSEPFELGGKQYSGIVLRGAIDIIEWYDDDKVSVGDLKVGSARTPDKNSAASSIQLPTYAILIQRAMGLEVAEGTLYHFVDSKRPHFTPRTVKFTPKYLDAITLRINTTIEAIKNGIFPPGDPFWVCNDYRCEYHSTCKMGAGVDNE